MGDVIPIMRSAVLTLSLLALLAFSSFAEDVESVEDPPTDEDYNEDDPAQQGKEELEKMDTNKDGKADIEELTKYMRAEFYQPEDIKEEGLTEEQVKEKSSADAKEYLEELDKNKDGSVDLEEFTAHYKEDLDEMDEELDEAGEDGEEGGEDAEEEEAEEET